MKSGVRCILFGLVVLLGTIAGFAAEASVGFGEGGPSLGLFFPDLSEVSAFAQASGFPALEGSLWLAGGHGRSGSLGGISVGGCGWGAWIESKSGEQTTRYVVGWGGSDVGLVIGGSERSVLTIGAVLGGGGGGLELIDQDVSEGTPVPLGITIEPTHLSYGVAFLATAPYVDMQIMPFDWIGIGVRAAYLVSPISFSWLEIAGDAAASPELAPSGLVVSFAIVFGGMAGMDSRAQE